ILSFFTAFSGFSVVGKIRSWRRARSSYTAGSMRILVPLLHNVTNVAVIVYALWIMFFATELDFSLLRLLLSFVAGAFLIQALPFGQALVPILWERWWLGVPFSE